METLAILESEKLSVTISAKGAELSSVKNKKTNFEFIWQADKSIWNRHAPLLFPIVGKLKNDSFSYENKNYKLTQHGFARDMNFIMCECNQHSVVFELNANENTLKVFPFHFLLRVKYELLNSKLKITSTVFNPAPTPLFFSFGLHPAFNLIEDSKNEMSNYFLEFSVDENTERHHISNGLLNLKTSEFKTDNKKYYLNKTTFANDAIVLKQIKSNNVALKNNCNSHTTNIKWNSEFKQLGIWSKKDCDKFICIEPWAGITDNENCAGKFIEKEAILKLNYCEEKVFECEIDFLI